MAHFGHFIMFKECLSDVETPHFSESKGGFCLWPKDGYIKMSLLSNFQENHFKCLQKFVMKL